MDSLPNDLLKEIFTYLSHPDRLSISLTCRRFNTLVKPQIFNALHFGGAPGVGLPHSRGMKRAGTIALTDLYSAVDELLAMGIAPFVKKLDFSPKRYVKDFWTKYEQWVQKEITDSKIDIDPEQYNDYVEYDEDGDWDEDEYASYEDAYLDMVFQEIEKRKRTRLEVERELIEEYEEDWQEQVLKQEQKKDELQKALTRLFENMTSLSTVEVGTWELDMYEMGFNGRTPEKVHGQFSRGEILRQNTEFVATSLAAAGRKIQHLQLTKLDGSVFCTSAAMKHVFQGLVSIDFQFHNSEFATKPDVAEHALTELMDIARPSLRKISWNMSQNYIPEPGAHSVAFLSKPGAQDLESPGSWTFPLLEEFHLKRAVVVSAPFVQFLSAQTALRTASFQSVYLFTKGTSWDNVASNLPASLEDWSVRDCGWNPYRPDVFPENTMKMLKPHHDYLKLSPQSGWRPKDPFDESDPDPRLYINFEGINFRLRDRNPVLYPPITWEERNRRLGRQMLDCLTQGVYVRR